MSTSACIIRPFPGHLTRHPHTSPYFKLPMAHYLEDAAELYRQFLRHMVETQWLLSSIVPFEDIPLKTGLDLLARGKRKNPFDVATAITEAWNNLNKTDTDALVKAGVPPNVPPPTLDIGILTNQIARLRKEVYWKLADENWHQTNNTTEALYRPLSINAVGYSMGGFVAQATMFTWPQLVASCTMLASGGSLSDVQAPFVHEQEWLYVLDRLLPDLENPAIAGQIPVYSSENTSMADKRTPDKIYGLPRGYYSAFRRAFDQIFMQRSVRRREYTAWLEEFHESLLFVLGGRDPVVKVANVIETAPPSGLNVMEVAGLKHELHDRQREWQKFWLPRIVTRNIEHFARRREKAHYKTLKTYWTHQKQEVKKNDIDSSYDTKSDKELLKAGRKEMSLSKLEDELALAIKWMYGVGSISSASERPTLGDYAPFLVIARNRVPCELFSEEAFLQKYGIVQHYSEKGVIDAENSRCDRRRSLMKMDDRLLVILPSNYIDRETQSVGGPLAQWPDATGGHDWSPRNTKEICDDLKKDWTDKLNTWEPVKSVGDTLPDCWFFFSWNWMHKVDCKKSDGQNGFGDGIKETIEKIDFANKTTQEPDSKKAGTAKKNLRKHIEDYLNEVRIIKVSPAHVVSNYAGYEILNWKEKLNALSHLQKVLPTIKTA